MNLVYSGVKIEAKSKILWHLILFILLFLPTPASSKTTECELAKQYVAKGKTYADSTYYHKAIDLCPGYIRPYELLGNWYRKKSDFKKAIELFSKAADLGSTNHKLYYLLADLHFNSNNYTKAIYHLNKSFNIKKGYLKALELRRKLDQVSDVKGPIIELFEPSAVGLNRVAHFYKSLGFRGQVKDQSKIVSLTIGQIQVPFNDNGHFLIDIPLQKGLNTVGIECRDEIGNSTNLEVNLHKAENISDTKVYRKSFAVIVGIDDYEKVPKLGSAVSDAKAVHSIFSQNEFQDITMILNEEATQRRILTELYSELPKKIERDDRLIFYFAGHGMTLKKTGKPEKGYIIPVESSSSDYPDTAISMSQIRDLCSHIKAKHIMFIMDSCYAGQIITDGQWKSKYGPEVLGNMSHKRVIQIITAGDKDQVAYEGEEHGLFTQYLLESIAGRADINKDQVITGNEMGQYIVPLVTDITEKQQTPIFAHIEGQGDVLFFYQK